jgi:hypothetical protein
LIAKLDEKPLQEGINQVDISRALLRIVAELPKNEYIVSKSNGHIRRQVAERELNDLPDPASDTTTSEG